MYQALYRKWRPQTFDDVIGQQHITESLKKQIQSGRLSHAYLFNGNRGTGKTSCARILAKAVNCERPVNGNPCLECPSCRAIAEGSVMDIVELDAASNNGVDNVRALREEAAFSPSVLKKRVYIIDEVHMLSNSAFNALLKILEEPPAHLLFILATTELQKVPATILSRCQRHNFRRIEASSLSAYLQKIAEKEAIPLSPEAAQLIAALAEGGVRDALSMLDQCSAYGAVGVDEVYNAVGLAGNKRTMELFQSITERDVSASISQFHSLWAGGKDPAALLRELSSLVRDVLMLKVAPRNAEELIFGGYDRAALKEFAARLEVPVLSGILEKLQKALGSMREQLSPKMTAELCIISLCTEPAGDDTLQGFAIRLTALEEALKNGAPVSACPEEKRPAPSAADSAPVQKTEAAAARTADIPPAPQENVGEKKPVQAGGETGSVQAQPSLGDVWLAVLEKVKPMLPPDMRPLLSKASEGYVENNLFIFEAEPGFYYARFNRPEILEAFASAASEVVGRQLSALVREHRPKRGEPKSLEELRKFPEVRFT